MSIRYGIDLVLQPSFTAKLYQTRQILCGQYCVWAAEMQMLRMALTVFPCRLTGQLCLRISKTSAGNRRCKALHGEPLGIVADHTMNGVVVEFQAPPALFVTPTQIQEARSRFRPDSYPSMLLAQGCTAEYGAFPEAILPDASTLRLVGRRAWSERGVAEPGGLLLNRSLLSRPVTDWSGGRWSADLLGSTL